MDATKIRIAEQHQIFEFDAIASELFAAILGLDYSECLVTDESSLSDFFLSGMPLDEFTEQAGMVDQWDGWVIEKIADRYGVKLDTTDLSLVDLFNRIHLSRKQQVH